MTRTTLRRRLVLTFVALGALIAILVAAAVGAVGPAVRRAVDRSSTGCSRPTPPSSDLNVALLRPGDRVPRLRPHRRATTFLDAVRRRAAGSRAGQARLRDGRGRLPGPARPAAGGPGAAVAGWRTEVAGPGIAQVRAGERLDARRAARRARSASTRSATAVADYRDADRAPAPGQRRASCTRDVALLFGTLGCRRSSLLVASAVADLGGAAPLGHPAAGAARRRGRPGRGRRPEPARSRSATRPTEIAVLAEQVDRMRSRILQEYALAEASRLEALEARAAGRGAGRGPAPVERRARAVRLRRLARPAGAAAQGGELLPAHRAPLQGPARRARRAVHRVRGRRREADAAAHQRPAGVLAGGPGRQRLRAGRPRAGARAGRAPARAGHRRGRTPSSPTTRCRRSTATTACSSSCSRT